MAKFFQSEKRRRRALTALSALLAASLSFGVLAACATTPSEEEEPTETAATPVDTQLIKNGNFEFYSDKTVEDKKDKRNLISTPTSWSFTSGSPSSDTRSGIIDSKEWGYLSASGRSFSSVDDAVQHWSDDGVTAYDRLKFLQDYSTEISNLDSKSEAAELFADYKYTIDFEDVEFLREEVGDTFKLYENSKREANDTSVLMIHNRRTSDKVRGTAQYYTSSTTITLAAGTAAKVSAWVRTDALYHYYGSATSETDKGVPVENRAGAYIGVTHTVGGKTADPMQIKNINTKGEWQQYTMYIRANTYATSTFRIVLGLGQGSSDNRYEAVDGYAFFDDVECSLLTAKEFDTVTTPTPETTVKKCELDTNAKDKLFDAKLDAADIYALDLREDQTDVPIDFTGGDDIDVNFDLTKEVSGRHEFTSASRGFAADNRGMDEDSNIVELTTLDAIKDNITNNGYLANIYKNDFKDKFPFDNEDVILLLSANGAAYTATLKNADDYRTFTLEEHSRMLVSFFVKTSEIRSGRSGAGAILVDGENKTTIAPFDSTTIATVDLDSKSDDETKKDIYKGWVQCFFFVENDTEEEKSFSIELTYGPTAIASSTAASYGEGYAAFANFSTRELSASEYGYVSTGDRAKKVSLASTFESSTKFDDYEAASPSIEKNLSNPANFRGIAAGSKAIVAGSEKDNVVPDGVYTGLLNYQHAKNYMPEDEDPTAWKELLNTWADDTRDPNEWWTSVFGDGTDVARQPLVIMSSAKAGSYGYRIATTATVSANSYRRISVRVMVSANAKAYIYLTETTDIKSGFDTRLAPELPQVTYWYDDDGNICASDPTAKGFKKSDILFYIEENGLYTRSGDTSGIYYANLANFEEEDGNLVTTDGSIAYYGKDGKYYAYYDEATGVYSTPVTQLPYEINGKSILRYDYLDLDADKLHADYDSKVVVNGSEVANKWVTVTFYVRAGENAKNYRLEVWSGDRSNDKDGIAENSYVFFDNYKSEDVSSTYAAILEEAESKLKEDENNLDGDKLKKTLALYYTFTFFDSAAYLRYDKTLDEKELGNHWGSYTQSNYKEQIVWLLYKDLEGDWTGSPSVNYFLDFSAADVTIYPDVLDEVDDVVDDVDPDTEKDKDNDANIWLILSSAILAVVLVFVIVVLIVRRVLEHLKKTGKIKPAKDKKSRKKGSKAQKEESDKKPAAPEKPVDEDNPYNE